MNNEKVEKMLFLLDEALHILNDGGDRLLALETIVRYCGYLCEISLEKPVLRNDAQEWLLK